VGLDGAVLQVHAATESLHTRQKLSVPPLIKADVGEFRWDYSVLWCYQHQTGLSWGGSPGCYSIEQG